MHMSRLQWVNQQALLLLWPAASARQGRTGLDQVGKSGVAQGQLDWILCLDQTQAWVVSAFLFAVMSVAVRRRCCGRVQPLPGRDILDKLRWRVG